MDIGAGKWRAVDMERESVSAKIYQTDSFAQLIHDLADHRRKFCATFDPEATGTDEEFLLMKETMYAKDLIEAFRKFVVVPKR